MNQQRSKPMNELNKAFDVISENTPLFISLGVTHNLCALDRTLLVKAFCQQFTRLSDEAMAEYSTANDIPHQALVNLLNDKLLTVWQQQLVNFLFDKLKSNIQKAFSSYLSIKDFSENLYCDHSTNEFAEELMLDNKSRAQDMNLAMAQYTH
jgi:hypothetical protein